MLKTASMRVPVTLHILMIYHMHQCLSEGSREVLLPFGSVFTLSWWWDPGTVTRFSRPSGLLSAASRSKVELITEPQRAARCCRDVGPPAPSSIHFWISSFWTTKLRWRAFVCLFFPAAAHIFLRGGGIKVWGEAAACSADLQPVLTHTLHNDF